MNIKIIDKILLGLTSLCILFGLSTKVVFAASGSLDQQCRTVADLQGSMSITNRTDLLQQTFMPTQDRLTQVNILVNGDGVGTVTLWIVQNTDTGAYYINTDGPLPEPKGKAMMYFHFNDAVMIPNTSYTILPNASDDTKLEWYYQENCYDRGVGHMGTVPKSFDFAFQSYSYMSEIPLTGTPIMVFTATKTPTATVTVTPTAKTSVSPTVTATPTNNIQATTSLTPILEKNPEIPIPSLEYVLNDLQKEENMGATIELNGESDFVLYGKGVPGAKILISIGDNFFETTVDENGFWYLKVPINGIKSGEYAVKGQTQIDGAGGEIVDLINVKVINNPVEAVAKQLTSGYSTLYPYAIGLLIILIGLVLLAIYFSEKKKKQMKTEKTLKKDEKEVVVEKVEDLVNDSNQPTTEKPSSKNTEPIQTEGRKEIK